MSVAQRRAPPMRVADFMEWVEEKPDSERWELLDGEPVPMSPQSERHQVIVLNLVRRLADLAEAKGCRALPGLAVLSAAVDDFAPIPDVVVRCGPLLPDGYARDAVLVAEVLSPTTMSIDRDRKAPFFKTLPTLRSLLIVAQDRPRIDHWRRESDRWEHRAVGPGGTIDLPELDGTLAVDAVYSGIPLDPA